MYAWIWPFRTLAIALACLTILFLWVFPWVEARFGLNEVTVSG